MCAGTQCGVQISVLLSMVFRTERLNEDRNTCTAADSRGEDELMEMRSAL